jgi:diguanylate cyclase (GGDEF)-like protein
MTWSGWRLCALWVVSVSAILLLGVLRVLTDAEFTFASLAILPVIAIAWSRGRGEGLLIAVLATAMWIVTDIFTAQEYSAHWIPWANAATRLLTYSIVVIIAAQVRVQLQGEHERATQDALTGLQNRRAFMDSGNAEIERSSRYKRPLAVIFLDLDNFKQLNDSRGHDAGDAALKVTAAALRDSLRTSDRVARLGGDEFAVILPETTEAAAAQVSKKILGAVNHALAAFPPVTVSLGAAWFETAEKSFADMLKTADELMYEAKKRGRNNLQMHSFCTTSAPPVMETRRES